MDAVLGAAIMAITRSAATNTIVPPARQLATASMCAIVAAVLVTTSVGCAAAALWIWTVPRLGPVGAPLVVAAFLLVGGLAVLALMRHILRRRRMPYPDDLTPELLLAEAMHLFKHHKATVLLAALIAGLAAGRNER